MLPGNGTFNGTYNENKYTWRFLDPGVSYETILTY